MQTSAAVIWLLLSPVARINIVFFSSSVLPQHWANALIKLRHRFHLVKCTKTSWICIKLLFCCHKHGTGDGHKISWKFAEVSLKTYSRVTFTNSETLTQTAVPNLAANEENKIPTILIVNCSLESFFKQKWTHLTETWCIWAETW